MQAPPLSSAARNTLNDTLKAHLPRRRRLAASLLGLHRPHPPADGVQPC
jgi:hypothetical protein